MRVFTLIFLLAGAAHADFKRLHAERASATSFLESTWNRFQENYHPTYVLDDDPKTAWVEGVEGDGVGQSLSVSLSALKKARALRLVITPGYQKSKALFAANGAPTSLTVTVQGPAKEPSATTTLTLKPVWGAQTFDVPLSGGLATVTLTIAAVRAGTTYKDTCVSDVQFFVDSDVPYDKRVEEARHAAMLAWKKERFAAAKEFAALPATWPFAATSYDMNVGEPKLLTKRYAAIAHDKNGEVTKTTPNPAFVELDALVDSGKLPVDDAAKADLSQLRALVKQSKGGAWFTVSTKTKVRAPEGFADGYPEPIPAAVMPLLRTADVSLFEAAKPELSLVVKPLGGDGLVRSAALSTVRLLDGTPLAPKKAFAKHVEVVSERGDYEDSSWLLFTWGDDGLLRRLVIWKDSDELTGGGRMMEDSVDPKDYPPEQRRDVLLAVEVFSFDVKDGKFRTITRTAFHSYVPELYEATDETGLMRVDTVFEPRKRVAK